MLFPSTAAQLAFPPTGTSLPLLCILASVGGSSRVCRPSVGLLGNTSVQAFAHFQSHHLFFWGRLVEVLYVFTTLSERRQTENDEYREILLLRVI